MARTAILALLVALLLGATSPAARPGPPSAEEERWIRDLLRQLGANSPAVRRGAEKALAEMGPDAIPYVVDSLGEVRGQAAREGLKRALGAMGIGPVTTVLKRLQADARGERAKRIAELLDELAGGSLPGAETRIALAPGTLSDPDVLPLGGVHPVTDRVPARIASDVRGARAVGQGLEVDADGDGSAETRVDAAAPRVVEVALPSGRVPVLFFSRMGTWWAAPAAVLRGEERGRSVEVLDADLDGDYAGARDYLRWQGGAFGPHDAAHLVLLDDALAAYEVRKDESGWSFVARPEARPQGAPPEAWRGVVALGRLRHALGLPPVRLDLVKSRGCRRHAEWLRLNAGTPATAGLAGHYEKPGSPGYSDEGAAAGASSVLAPLADPGDAVRMFYNSMLHRTDLLGEGDFGFGSASGWTVLWGDDGGIRSDGTPIVVPAPGQKDVPLRAQIEEPPPDDPPGWYARPHGFPVSVSALGRHSGADLRLFEGEPPAPVPGRFWSPERPISAGMPHNGGAAFFMAEAPLKGKTVYVAEYSATEGTTPVRHVWSFRTR